MENTKTVVGTQAEAEAAIVAAGFRVAKFGWFDADRGFGYAISVESDRRCMNAAMMTVRYTTPAVR